MAGLSVPARRVPSFSAPVWCYPDGAWPRPCSRNPAMRRLLRWLLFLALFIGAGTALAVPGVKYWKEKTAPRYLTVAVSRGRVESVVNSTGTVKPIRTVQVGACVSG